MKLSYLFLLVFTFSFAFLVAGPMPYFLFYVSILGFLIPLVHLLISFIGVAASIYTKDNHIYAGESINLKCFIKNNNFFPIPKLKTSLSIDRNLEKCKPVSKIISLRPRQQIDLDSEISFKRRGFYKNIDFHITISDIYSLFVLKKNIKNEINLFVYPNIVVLDSFKIFSDKSLGNILVKNSIFKDKSNVSSIKEYIEGDSINKIHWKISAKRGFPMVKEFEQISNTNISIFIDNNKVLFKNDIFMHMEDKLVETALAIINYFLNLDIAVSLNTQSKKEYIEISNMKKDQLKFYLEHFALHKSNGEKSITSLIEGKIYSFTKDSVIIIISTLLDKSLGETAIKLKMKNLIPIIIIISDRDNNNSNIDLDIKKRLIEENINLHFIDYNSNIKEILEIKNA